MKLRVTQVLIAYPLLLVISFYATWLAGRISLGYWPRSSLDDPKYIDGFWMWTYDLTALLLIAGFPVVTLLAGYSVFRALQMGSPDKKIKLIEAALGIILLILTAVFLAWDPHLVVEWFLD